MTSSDQAPAQAAGAPIAAGPSLLDDARALVARVPVALWILLAAGVLLRIAFSLAYEPPVLNLADSVVYVGMAADHLFTDPSRTVGYSIALRALHALWGDVEFTLVVQHLLGIATGLLVYATVRRLEVPRWVALLPAAAVLLSLDQIFLEHALMPETLFTFALVACLYCCVRALDDPRPLAGPVTTRLAWLLGAGVLLGFTAWIRPVTAPLAPFLALWIFFALPGSWRPRLAGAAIAVVATGAVLLGYFALNDHYTGYFGFSQSSGWGFYSRVAPFADCTKFTPPDDTQPLCETTASSARYGPDFYGWEPGSPARKLYGGQPTGDAELGAFARQAILHEPLSYAKAVARDFARYFYPVTVPAFYGVGYELTAVDRRAPGLEEDNQAAFDSYYSDVPSGIHGGVTELAGIQDVVRFHGAVLLVSLLLSVAGVFLVRGRVRRGLLLLLGASVLAMLVPVATAIWSARYAIPVTGPLVGAGAIGAWAIATRAAEIRRRRSEPAG
jgi:Dolichyl-phosphate-mannose-protein mannosyltransferase